LKEGQGVLEKCLHDLLTLNAVYYIETLGITNSPTQCNNPEDYNFNIDALEVSIVTPALSCCLQSACIHLLNFQISEPYKNDGIEYSIRRGKFIIL
jgi:hypothetical protein